MTTSSTQPGWQPLTSAWTPPAPTSAAPRAPARVQETNLGQDIYVGPDGRVHGADGMLDQIAQALTRHAGPMLARDVLPILQRDDAMQARVGQAAGTAMADTLKPWVIVGVGALGVLAAIEVYRFCDARRKASSGRSRP